MASAFPAALPASKTDYDGSDLVASADQNLQAEDINAIAAKVGIDSSAVTTSHDYKLSGVTGNDKAVSKTGVETLTNKTLTTPVIASIYQDAGKTKLMTLPNSASDTLVTLAATQTITGKTLTSPKINEDVALTATSTELNLLDGSTFIGNSSHTFLLIKDGSNYKALDVSGVAVSTSTDFAVPLQYALDNLPAGGGKIVIKGGSTYTFTVAHYAVGDTITQTMKIGVDLNNDNVHIVVEKGATITQANGLNLAVFFAGNIAGTGNGEVLDNITIEVYGWIDGNYAGQSYTAESTAFEACPFAMYCTNSHFPIIKAKNYGQYGVLVIYNGPNNRVGYILGQDSYAPFTHQAHGLDLERCSHCSVGEVIGLNLGGPVVGMNDGGDHINIGVINGKDCYTNLIMAVASSLPLQDIQIGQINGEGYLTGTSSLGGVLINSADGFGVVDNIQIDSCNISGAARDGVKIGLQASAVLVKRVHFGSLVLRNNMAAAAGDGALALSYCDDVKIDSLIGYDNQTPKTQYWGIKVGTGVTNLLVSGGNVTGNTDTVDGFTEVTNGHIQNLTGYSDWHAWTPTLTWGTADPATNVVRVSRYMVSGNRVDFDFYYKADDGNAASSLTVTLPFAPVNNSGFTSLSSNQKVDTTWSDPAAFINDTASTIQFHKLSACTDTKAVIVEVSGSYEI